MPVKRDAGLRFWEKVVVNGLDECWLWTAYSNQGYGQFSVTQKPKPAHVFSYWLQYGDFPTGWEVDHLCRNRICVNPKHLEAVPKLVNLKRQGAAKVHCPQGHLYVGENLYLRPNGRRLCRTCRREGMRKAA